ncbi:TNF superfamily member 14-like [Scleropages formosus]|uniref:TNF superfamily member 14-like n=1 Tax=Scleropages formosus TaxID=113540 RepID=A0A0P7YWI4_SCLFO|nr:TNF superfamily member 14-like [Scleropages formosus]
MTSGMGDGGLAYPPVFVVDSQARYLPPPGPRPYQKSPRQTLLYLLVTLALVGMAVEACFIYHLYQQGTTVQKDTMKAEKSTQGSSHLPKDDGILIWDTDGGDSFIHEMDHIAGKLYIKKEGFYFIYSKVFFAETPVKVFAHTVMKNSPRLPGTNQEVMRSRRYPGQTKDLSGVHNSYLGGVFLLHEGEAIFVVVQNHTLLRRQIPADNFFGAYMI